MARTKTKAKAKGATGSKGKQPAPRGGQRTPAVAAASTVRGASATQQRGSARAASIAGSTISQKVSPFKAMGAPGVVKSGGMVVSYERNPKWLGQNKYVTIADIAVNVSIVAASVHYFLNLIAHPVWTVTPPKDKEDDAEAKKIADLLQVVINDTRTSWARIVRRAAMFRFYGFSLQEWIAKKRKDGTIGFLDIEARPQFTVRRWDITDDGQVNGVYQLAPQDGTERALPRKKCVYLVDDTLTDNPEGIGVFRHLAEPFDRLKQYLELEARAYERDLRGTPIGRAPKSMIANAVKNGDLTDEQGKALLAGIEEFVRLQVKESTTGLVLDSQPYISQAADGDKIAASMMWGIELLKGDAAGLPEIATAIERLQREMARIMGTEILMMGDQGGNRALAVDKSRNLYLMANSVLSYIKEQFNTDIVDPFMYLNGYPEELKPVFKVEDVSFKDVAEVTAALRDMATAGAVLAPDDPVIDDVRDLMGVSRAPKNAQGLFTFDDYKEQPPPTGFGADDSEDAPDTSPGGDNPDDRAGTDYVGKVGVRKGRVRPFGKPTARQHVGKGFDPNQPRDDDGKWSATGYHGSPKTDLKTLTSEPGDAARQWDNATSQFGVFFAVDKQEAQRYAGKDGRVYEAQLDLQKPYRMSYTEFKYFQNPLVDAKGNSVGGEDKVKERAAALKIEARALRNQLVKEGHDGVIVQTMRGKVLEVASFADVVGKGFVAKGFDPNQPRDADGKWTETGAGDSDIETMGDGVLTDVMANGTADEARAARAEMERRLRLRPTPRRPADYHDMSDEELKARAHTFDDNAQRELDQRADTARRASYEADRARYQPMALEDVKNDAAAGNVAAQDELDRRNAVAAHEAMQRYRAMTDAELTQHAASDPVAASMLGTRLREAHEAEQGRLADERRAKFEGKTDAEVKQLADAGDADARAEHAERRAQSGADMEERMTAARNEYDDMGESERRVYESMSHHELQQAIDEGDDVARVYQQEVMDSHHDDGGGHSDYQTPHDMLEERTGDTAQNALKRMVGPGLSYSPSMEVDGGTIHLTGDVYRGGEKVAHMERSLDFDAGVATHGYLRVDESHQASGIGKGILQSQFAMYRSMGFSSVTLNADIDVGRYAWAKYGFVPDDWTTYREHIDDMFKSMPSSVRQLMGEDVVKVRSILSSDDPRSIWRLADYTTAKGRQWGKELMLAGPDWYGNFDLADAKANDRFDAYVGRGVAKTFTEADHPRHPEGDPKGGRFAPKGAGGGDEMRDELISQLTAANIDTPDIEALADLWQEHLPIPPAEFVRSMVGQGHGLTMHELSMKAYNANELMVSATLNNNKGELVAEFQRTFNFADNMVEHNSFSLMTEVQGAGIGKSIIGSQVNLYRNMGNIDKVKLIAGGEMGRYAWAKYGFVPDKDMWQPYAADIRLGLSGKYGDVSGFDTDEMRSALSSPTVTARDRRGLRVLAVSNDPKTIWRLSDYMTEAGSNLGKALMRYGPEWAGALDLHDPVAMARFDAYTMQRRQ